MLESLPNSYDLFYITLFTHLLVLVGGFVLGFTTALLSYFINMFNNAIIKGTKDDAGSEDKL